MNTILFTVAVLTAIGLLAAAVLYLTARKFHVEEDERIDLVQELLPGANCGGCGSAGCRAFAQRLVSAESLDGLFCPVGGDEAMGRIAACLGKSVAAGTPRVAVVRCNGNCTNRPQKTQYDGAPSCAIVNNLYAGPGGCAYGCLGCGDCVKACAFGALSMDKATGLPVVDADRCTACGACVKACPRHLIELRKKAPKNRQIYVACMNGEKGAEARKACAVPCLGCGQCARTCPFDAITLTNRLAWIDSDKCRLCRKCVDICTMHCILEVNFPPRKVTPPAAAAPASREASPAAPAAEASAPAAEASAPAAEAPRTPEASGSPDKQESTLS